MEKLNEPIEPNDTLWQGRHYVTSCLFKVAPATRAVILCITSTLYNFGPGRYREVPGSSASARGVQAADYGGINLQGGAEPNSSGNAVSL